MEKQIVSVKRLASGELVAYGLKPNQQIFLQTDGTFKITTTSSTATNSQPTPSTSNSQPTPSTTSTKPTATSSSPSASEAGSQFSHLQGMFDEEVRKFSASILFYLNQFKSGIVRNFINA